MDQFLKKRIEGKLLFVTIRGRERAIPLDEPLPLVDQFGNKTFIYPMDCSNEELLQALTGIPFATRSSD